MDGWNWYSTAGVECVKDASTSPLEETACGSFGRTFCKCWACNPSVRALLLIAVWSVVPLLFSIWLACPLACSRCLHAVFLSHNCFHLFKIRLTGVLGLSFLILSVFTNHRVSREWLFCIFFPLYPSSNIMQNSNSEIFT